MKLVKLSILLALGTFLLSCRAPKEEIKVIRHQQVHKTERPPLELIKNPRKWLAERVKGPLRVGIPLQTLIGPDSLPWRPRRHFGPFYSGSDLNEIQIWFQSQNQTQLHLFHNNYFANHPDAAIFRKYYLNQTLPTGQTPSLSTYPRRIQTPGQVPSPSSNEHPLRFNDILLAMSSIHYSSKYGGSIRLVFRPLEDTEYEVRNGSTVWDIKGLEMSAYVNPNPSAINPSPPGSRQSANIQFEFTWDDLTQYQIVQGQRITSTTVEADRLGALFAAFAASGDWATIYYDLVRFAHGYFHGQFQNMIDDDDVVEEIEMSDNWAIPRTRDRQYIYGVTARAAFPVVTLDAFDDSELKVEIAFSHIFFLIDPNTGEPAGESWEIPVTTHTSWLKGGEQTPFRSYGSFLLSECDDYVITIFFAIQVTELDRFGDDHVDLINFILTLPGCADLNAVIQSNLVDQIDPVGENFELTKDGNTVGIMEMEFRVTVSYQ